MIRNRTNFTNRLLGLMLLVFGLFAGNAIGAGETEKPTGKVTFLKGTAEVKRSTAAWSPLKSDGPIYPGDEIRTGKKSRLEILLADKSVVRLGSKSSMLFDKAMFQEGQGPRQFSGKLTGGQAYALVTKTEGSDSSFQITTSNAVAGVRGTAFRVDSNQDKSTVVRVYTGAVAVSNAPIFSKSGKTEPTQTPDAGTPAKPETPKGVKPGGPGRVEVAGPNEVTKKEWEEYVAKALQEVRVAANGDISKPETFDAAKDERDEWVSWNKSRDQQVTP
jgi:hypothetical protein